MNGAPNVWAGPPEIDFALDALLFGLNGNRLSFDEAMLL